MKKESNIYSPTLTQFNSGAIRRLLSAGLAFCCLLLAACSDDEQKESPTPSPEPDEPAIVIPDTEDTAPVIAQEGGTVTVSFTASADWTAEATAVTRALDWVDVQPASGTKGDVTLTITTHLRRRAHHLHRQPEAEGRPAAHFGQGGAGRHGRRLHPRAAGQCAGDV